jgi:hypothetical protein
MPHFLLFAGFVFPLISWLTFALGFFKTRSGRAPSGVYVPLVGPVLLSAWLHKTSAPEWTLLLPWVFDIGTLFFIASAPSVLREFWRTSIFTRLFKLTGADGNESVEISFHRGGLYFLKKCWTRSSGQLWMIAIGESGKYLDGERSLKLCSDSGRKRDLAIEGEIYVVSDFGTVDDLQIQGWRLLEISLKP